VWGGRPRKLGIGAFDRSHDVTIFAPPANSEEQQTLKDIWRTKMRHLTIMSLLALTAMLPATAVLASGTAGGGYGSGSGSSPSAPSDPAAEAYSRGKSMVSKRIACKKCAYPAGVGDTPTAQKVAARVRAGEFNLKPAEREQVLYYLSRRFGA
jgi:hypothetical protein